MGGIARFLATLIVAEGVSSCGAYSPLPIHNSESIWVGTFTNETVEGVCLPPRTLADDLWGSVNHQMAGDDNEGCPFLLLEMNVVDFFQRPTVWRLPMITQLVEKGRVYYSEVPEGDRREPDFGLYANPIK